LNIDLINLDKTIWELRFIAEEKMKDLRFNEENQSFHCLEVRSENNEICFIIKNCLNAIQRIASKIWSEPSGRDQISPRGSSRIDWRNLFSITPKKKLFYRWERIL